MVGYARYIGRVGGLAVALGVGVAVATNPGAALADEQAPAAPDATSSQAVDQPPGDTAGSAASEGSTGSEAATGPEGSPGDSGGDPADIDGEMKVDSSGGAITSTTPGSAGAEESSDTEGSGAEPTDSDGAEPTTGQRQRAEKSGSDSPPSSSTQKKPKPAALDPTDTSSLGTDSGSSVSRSASEPDQLPSAGADEVTVQRTVQSPVASSEPVSSQRVAIDESPVVSDAAASQWVSRMLSWIGLSSSATGDVPSMPGESPVALAVMAAWRRMSQQASSGDASSLRPAEDTETSLMMAAAVVNSAPTASPVVGTASAATGAVTVNLNAADPDGNPLTYAVTTQPADGSLTTTTPGAYVFTPTQAARLLAGQTPSSDSNSFTVTISDGQGGSTPVTVSVPVSPTQVGAPSSVGVGSNPSGVAVNGSRVFVVNSSANTLTVYDTANNNALVRTVNVGAAPSAVVVSSNGSTVWVANSGGSTVSRIDTTSWQVSTVTVGSAPRGLALSPDGSTVWVANSGSNSVSRINTATNAVSAPIGVGWAPQSLAVSPDGASVWVANASSSTVQRINTATNAVGAHIYVGWVPSGIAVTNDRVLTSNQYSNSVSVVTVATGQVSTVNVGPNPTAITLSADRSLAFVANSNDTVSIIDTRTNTVIHTAAVDSIAESGAHGITVGADGRLYVTDAYDNSLRILTIARANSAPTTGTPVVGTPNAAGLVTGTIPVNDADGDSLTITVTTPPAHGSTVTVTPAGAFTYTPSTAARDAAAQPGGPQTATFTVTVSDGLASTTRQVTVSVLPTPVGNRPPTASPSPGNPNAITGVVTGNLNATDLDGNPLTYTVIGQPHNGSTVSVTSAGGFTFTPSTAARDAAVLTSGTDTDTFIVRVSDGQASIDVTVPVTVLPSNRAPVAGTPTVGGPNAATGTVAGTVNAADPDGNPLTYSVIGAPGKGSASVNTTTGAFSYTPTQAARNAATQTPEDDIDTFTVRISDGQATTDVVVEVPVAPANRAPVAGTPIVGNPDASTGAVYGTLNVTDPDGNPLTFTVTSQPVNGTVTMTGGTAFAYTTNEAARLRAGQTPGPDIDSFTVLVSDGVSSVSTTVTVPLSPTQISGPSSTTVGANPSGVALAPNRAYVVNTAANTLTVHNTGNNNALVRTVNLAPNASPTAVVVSADGSTVWVANTGNNTVSKISTTNWTVTNINVGAAPRALAIATDGSVWVANSSSNTVQRINPTTNAVGAPIGVGWAPSALAAAPDGSVWVANASSSTVQRINTATNAAGAHIYVGWVPTAIAVTNDRVFVSNQASNTVSAINIATSQVSTINVGPTPTAVALSRDRSMAYVVNSNDTVTIIDTRTNSVIHTAPVDLTAENGAHAIAVDTDGRIYVTDAYDNSLRVLTVARQNSAPVAAAPTVGSPDLSTGVVTGRINITDIDGNTLTYNVTGQPAHGSTVTVSPNGTFTYTPSTAARNAAAQSQGPDSATFTVTVSDGQASTTSTVTVTVLPTPPVNQIPVSVSSIELGTDPTAIAVSGNQVYVYGNGTVSVINTSTNTITENTAVPNEPPATSLDGTRRYVAAGDDVAVVDVATGNVVETIVIPNCWECGYGNTLGVEEVLISPNGRLLYVRKDYHVETGGVSAVTVVDLANGNTLLNTAVINLVSDMEITPNGIVYAADEDYWYPDVYVFSADMMTTLGNIRLTPLVGSLSWTEAFALNANRTRGYVIAYDFDARARSVSVIDTNPNSASYNTEIATMTGRTTAVSPDGSRRYAVQPDGRTVVVYDTATNTAIGSFVTDGNSTTAARSIVVAPNGNLYITDEGDDKVYVVTVGSTPLV